jgi:hypothetical protein
VQVLEHRRDELGTAPLRVEIFVPKYQRASVFKGALLRHSECSRVPDVQKSGWRGSKPSAI